VGLAVMPATERNSEFITDLACHCSILGKTKMMGVRGAPAADQARLLCHKLDVFAITNPARFRRKCLAPNPGVP
jgi:hypothetical protein